MKIDIHIHICLEFVKAVVNLQESSDSLQGCIPVTSQAACRNKEEIDRLNTLQGVDSHQPVRGGEPIQQ
eukprot:scaffold365550_cov18-Prasinocladus_malaysianus.AAC.1